MCFYVHPDHPEMKTAKRDIVCYKEGSCSSREQRVVFRSKYYWHIYDLGQLYKIEGKWPIEPTVNIHKGFHSYSNKKRLSRQYDRVRCIIPKGAHYFYNPDAKEYVSNQIIVQEFID